MGRRNRREPQEEPRDINLGGIRRTEVHPDGEWVVQKITGQQATKEYRCPGCDQVIGIGLAHTVTWPFTGRDDDVSGRRHWHNMCWQKRRDRR
mgnify:CR=1 FL=1